MSPLICGRCGAYEGPMAPCGTVKWFDADQEYGFIVPDEPGPDVFVHRAQVAAGRTIEEGQKVRYDVKNSPKGPVALNVEPSPS